MDPIVQREIQDPLRNGLNRMARDARSLVRVDEGDLRDAIEVKMSRDRLSGIVGPGVSAAEIVRKKTGSPFSGTIKRGKNAGKQINLRNLNKQLLFQFFKGYWLEFGTKGNPKKNIPQQPAYPFMGPAYKANIGQLVREVRRGVNRALNKAANGG